MTIIGAVFLILMTLKLLNQIDWSWWWVFAPIWGSAVVALVCALLAMIGVVVIDMRKRR